MSDRPLHVAADGTVAPLDDAMFAQWQADQAAAQAAATAPATPPDNPTLGDWRVALTLWGKLDAVTASVAAMMASSDPKSAVTGKVADQRLEYSNNVRRADLMQLKDAFGFTADQVDESLWRAAQVAKGDLSGVWPLPAG